MSDHPTNDDSTGDARIEDEPAQPRRRRAGKVRQVLSTGGFPADIFVEGEAARDVRRGKRPTPDLSDYRGHERVAVANLEDDPADA